MFPTWFFCEILLNFSGLVAIAPSGKEIFYANGIQNPPAMAVGALAVDGTGVLSDVPGSPFLRTTADAVVVHPSGKFVYTQNLDATGRISKLKRYFWVLGGFKWRTRAFGKLAFPNTSKCKPGVLLTDPSGKFFYLTNQFNTDGILGWSVNSTTGELFSLTKLTIHARIFVWQCHTASKWKVLICNIGWRTRHNRI